MNSEIKQVADGIDESLGADPVTKAVFDKAPKDLQWLVEMLLTPQSVRQLHRRTGASKKQLRAALYHLMALGVVGRTPLHGGGHLWFVNVGEEHA